MELEQTEAGRGPRSARLERTFQHVDIAAVFLVRCRVAYTKEATLCDSYIARGVRRRGIWDTGDVGGRVTRYAFHGFYLGSCPVSNKIVTADLF